MHYPTDNIAHTIAFVTPVVDYWLEPEDYLLYGRTTVNSLSDHNSSPVELIIKIY